MEGREMALRAADLVGGPRQSSYGPPQVSFARTAALWSAYLGHPVTPHDVAMLMALLKIARASWRAGGSPEDDNYVDMIGYAILAADLRQEAEDDGEDG